MQKMIACFATSMSNEVGEKIKSKFPPRPVKKPVSVKSVSEDTHKRFPRIMAELAK